jgi:pimeloyl-ACP methyl ester carboxylesterase
MMTNWTADKIKTNGIHLYYTRTGGAKPPVVLAHGFSDDGLCWTPVAEVLETDYEMKELVPQLQIAHIPGAGHNIRREQFTPYIEAVRTFLAQAMKGS